MKRSVNGKLSLVAPPRTGIHAQASPLAEATRRKAMALHPSSWVRDGGDPEGFRINGEVMIRRLCLVAGPAGSEWRNRRQQHPTITNPKE